MSARSIAAERARRAADNTTIAPADLLRSILEDIENGSTRCDGLVVCTIYRPEGDEWKVNYYRAGMKRMDEIALYGVAHHHHIRTFRTSEDD